MAREVLTYYATNTRPGRTWEQHVRDVECSKLTRRKRRVVDPLYGRTLSEKLTRWRRERRSWAGLPKRSVMRDPGDLYVNHWKSAGVVKLGASSVSYLTRFAYGWKYIVKAMNDGDWPKLPMTPKPEVLVATHMPTPGQAEQLIQEKLRERGILPAFRREFYDAAHLSVILEEAQLAGGVLL